MLGFKNINHFMKMNEFKKRIPAHAASNLNFLAIVYLVTGHEKLYRDVEPYFAIDKGFLDVDSMLAAEIKSPSIRILAGLIGELYTGESQVTLGEMLQHLDSEDHDLVQLMYNAYHKRFATMDIQEFQYQPTPDDGSIIH